MSQPLTVPSGFHDASPFRELTVQERKEIQDYFRYLNLCGECGHWLRIPFLARDSGVCLQDFLDAQQPTVRKRHALDFGCPAFIHWDEYVWGFSSPFIEKLIEKAKYRFCQTSLSWAAEALRMRQDIGEHFAWSFFFAQLLQELNIKSLAPLGEELADEIETAERSTNAQ